MALIGYARVSSVGQSLVVQRDKLRHCEKIFEEKKSGASGKCPRLEACLEYVRAGDTLVITRLDRLARSTGSWMASRKPKHAACSLVLNASSLMSRLRNCVSAAKTGV
jgi:DNA invertase Pin-like site-specific DNA recombinase